MKEVSSKDIRLAAMDLLARREHSRRELLQKLSRRFPNEAERVGVEVCQLTAEGLQNDSRLAEAFTRARTSRGQGPSKISTELKDKGVTDADILLAFEEAEVDWFALASEVVLKKFGDLSDQEVDIRLKARVSRFLQQRGFSYDHIASLY